MKIALGLLAAPAVFGKESTPRKLNQVDYYEFLQNYEQVYMTCDTSMQVTDADGNIEYGAVVARFCPTGATCDSSGHKKCASGYGDYVVGIQTYTTNFLEQFQRNREEAYEYNQANGQGDDNYIDFDFGQYGECKQYKANNNNNNKNNDNNNNAAYYIGPKCSNGDISLALFTDENCQYESEVTFETLTGVALPWTNSIAEDTECKPYYCYGTNDKGEAEYNDLCVEIYDSSIAKCETNMATYSAYGQVTAGCESISAMLPQDESGGGGGIFLIVVLIAAVAGFGVWYFLQKKKKSAVNQEGLMM